MQIRAKPDCRSQLRFVNQPDKHGSMVNDQTADWLRQMHPHRIRYEIFSDKNLVLRQLGKLAETIRANRRPAGAENPFLAMEDV